MRFNCLMPAAGLVATSCLEIVAPPQGDRTNDASPSITDAAADTAPAFLPIACRLAPQLGVTLCEETPLCPGLRLETDVYPDCGFRYPSQTIDVECVCDDALCPVGTVLDCDQARRLLDEQSALVACIQRSEGRCAVPRSSR